MFSYVAEHAGDRSEGCLGDFSNSMDSYLSSSGYGYFWILNLAAFITPFISLCSGLDSSYLFVSSDIDPDEWFVRADFKFILGSFEGFD